MAMDVNVDLTLVQPTGTASFGIPFFVVPNAVESGEADKPVPYTECTSLDDVILTGFKTTSKLYNAVKLMFQQSPRPKVFAIYGGKSAGVIDDSDDWIHKGWRQLITVNLGTSKIVDIASLVETLDKKVYFPSISIEGADTMTDTEFKEAWEKVIGQFKTFERTVVMYYDNSIANPEAALVGATAALDVGSFTYKNIILKGVPPLPLNDFRLRVISGTDDTGHGLTVVKKAGSIVTTDGKVASGEYIDVIDSKDWIVENIAYDSQELLNRLPKVPFTTPGITQLENVVISVLKTGFDNGMIAPTEENENVGNYTTDFAPVSEVSATDKKERHYSGGKFFFELAGAIHTADVYGTITV